MAFDLHFYANPYDEILILPYHILHKKALNSSPVVVHNSYITFSPWIKLHQSYNLFSVTR